MSLSEHEVDVWVRGVVEFAEGIGATEQLRAALVRVRIQRSDMPFFPNLPTPPAGADEPEADPPETVAADPSIVDAESDTVYGDAVKHAGIVPRGAGRITFTATCRDCGTTNDVYLFETDETRWSCGSCGAKHDASAETREHERQAWLRRVQAQPIR